MVQIVAFLMAGAASTYNMPGSRMANGHLFWPQQHVCAMLHGQPFGERILIVNNDNGRSSWCVVSDHGPYYTDRVIDVSPLVARELGGNFVPTKDRIGTYTGIDGSVTLYVIKKTLRVCGTRPQPETCKTPPPAPCVLDLPKPAIVVCNSHVEF